MSFNFQFENQPLPQYLLQQYIKDNILNNYLSSIDNFCLNIDIPDLANMIKIDIDIYNKTLKIDNYLNGNNVISEMTDNVFKMEVNRELSAKILYKEYISKILTMKNLYGILGKDENTGEIINFNHPFRAIQLTNNNTLLKIGNLYIYKKINNLFQDKINDEEKIIIKNYLDLYCACYKKGLVKEIVKKDKNYIHIIKDTYQNYRFRTISLSCINNFKSNKSFLYYSDLIQYDSFMPHFSIFNLKVEHTRLIGTFLKYCPCLMPNISLTRNVCTGNFKNISKEGIECLKISNLSSPYNTSIFCNKSYDFYHKYCLVKSKKIYEEVFGDK